MHVLSLLSRKGGTGKSTLCRAIAVEGLLHKRKVGIIDADEQGTVTLWGRRRPHAAPSILSTAASTIDKHLAELRKAGADLVLIDTPPNVQPIINLAIGKADSSVIVSGVFPDDLEQVAVLAELLRKLKKPAGIVLNRTPSRAAALNLARTALTTFGVPICPQAVSQLVAHPYASASGLTASEWEPAGKGARELAGVWSWLVKERLL
jgi:chromosome partitioning protein